MPNTDELIAKITERVAINIAAVGAARKYVLQNHTENSTTMIIGFLTENAKNLSQSELLNDTNKNHFINQLADWASWNNSIRRAINELHSEGLLYVTNSRYEQQNNSAYFTEGNPHQSVKFSLSFNSILEKVHSNYLLNPVYKDSVLLQQSSDICLNNLQLSSAIGTTVSSDLEQAVECYKKHLYLPAVVMIGRATEGAWTSMAASFVPIMIDCPNKNQLQKMLTAFFSLANLMEKVNDAYVHKRFDKPISCISGVSVPAMKQSYLWSDQIRGYRNAVHPAAEPPVLLNQENTTSIFLSVNSHFPRFDKIIKTAKQLANE